MIRPLLKLGWIVRHFEAHTKYLQLADKASRTVAVLTERLDQRRGRGQQQITMKHVTVNADQAVVADQIVSGKAILCRGLMLILTSYLPPCATLRLPAAMRHLGELLLAGAIVAVAISSAAMPARVNALFKILTRECLNLDFCWS